MAEWRPDRRQVLRALLLAAAGLAVPSACGVPSGGGPIVDGPGPSYDPSTGARDLPPVPGDANTPTELVQLFLDAISGPLNTPDAVATARSRARQFLTGQALNTWKPPDAAITVVRLGSLTSSISGSATIVSGLLQTVGTFRGDRGEVDPASSVTAPVPVKFTVSQGANTGMLISELPSVLQSMLPLGTDALAKYFSPQVIYFWDNRQRYLVPDLRYVPNAGLTDNARLTTIVRWLLANPGPSDLLNSVAVPFFPSGTDLSVATLTKQGGQLVVPFSSELQAVKGGDLGKVLAQLSWSLHPLYKLDSPLELQIGGQPQHPSVLETSEYLSVNPADAVNPERAADPQPFCVAGGAVTALDGTLPAIVAKPEYNHDVLKAALSRDRRSAALLSTGKRLTIGRIDDSSLTYRPVELSGETWSRPNWLLSERLLVAVDGELVAVSSTGVVSPPVLPGVSAFAVSADGYRIALIVNGNLAVAALRDDPDQLTISNLRILDSGLTDLTDVAWSRLERMVVAGKAGPNQWRLAEVSVDGALQTILNISFANPIVSVVAYPRLASDLPGPGQVMVQTQDKAVFRVFIGTAIATIQQLGLKPSPEPSPSGSGNAPRVPLTAPFYPD